MGFLSIETQLVWKALRIALSVISITKTCLGVYIKFP